MTPVQEHLLKLVKELQQFLVQGNTQHFFCLADVTAWDAAKYQGFEPKSLELHVHMTKDGIKAIKHEIRKFDQGSIRRLVRVDELTYRYVDENTVFIDYDAGPDIKSPGIAVDIHILKYQSSKKAYFYTVRDTVQGPFPASILNKPWLLNFSGMPLLVPADLEEYLKIIAHSDWRRKKWPYKRLNQKFGIITSTHISWQEYLARPRVIKLLSAEQHAKVKKAKKVQNKLIAKRKVVATYETRLRLTGDRFEYWEILHRKKAALHEAFEKKDIKYVEACLDSYLKQVEHYRKSGLPFLIDPEITAYSERLLLKKKSANYIKKLRDLDSLENDPDVGAYLERVKFTGSDQLEFDSTRIILEKKQPLLSIVIPVYNSADYLKNALDKLGEQSVDPTLMEIIIVDDGSTDETSTIADSYAAEYENIFALHQKNSGPGIARNTGMDAACGDYIFFHDADDYMGPRAVELIIQHVQEWNPDIMLVRFGKTTRYPRYNSIFSKSAAQVDIYHSAAINTIMPAKVFRRDFLTANALRFKVVCTEDTLFLVEAYLRAQIISVAADYDYYYVIQRQDYKNITHVDTASESSKAIALQYSHSGIMAGVTGLAEIIEPYLYQVKISWRICSKLLEVYAWIMQLMLACEDFDAVNDLPALQSAIAMIWNADKSPRFDLGIISLFNFMLLQALMDNRDAKYLAGLNDQMLDSTIKLSSQFLLEDGKLLFSYFPDSQSSPLTVDISQMIGIRSCKLKVAHWDGHALHIEGVFTQLGDVQSHIFLRLQSSSKFNPEEPCFLCSISEIGKTEDQNDTQVLQSNYLFSCDIDFQEIANKSSESAVRASVDSTANSELILWQVFLDFDNPSMTQRIGQRRVPGLFWDFISGGTCLTSGLSSQKEPMRTEKNLCDSTFFIPFETNQKELMIAQFPSACDVSGIDFVQVERSERYNRVILQALRDGRNDIVQLVLEEKLAGLELPILAKSDAVYYSLPDYQVCMAKASGKYSASLNSLQLLSSDGKLGLLFSGALDWGEHNLPDKIIFSFTKNKRDISNLSRNDADLLATNQDFYYSAEILTDESNSGQITWQLRVPTIDNLVCSTHYQICMLAVAGDLYSCVELDFDNNHPKTEFELFDPQGQQSFCLVKSPEIMHSITLIVVSHDRFLDTRLRPHTK